MSTSRTLGFKKIVHKQYYIELIAYKDNEGKSIDLTQLKIIIIFFF